MFEIFIKRPVLSLVISIVITILGVLAVIQLPITQYPDIVPPSVTVTAKYTGASAEVCAKAVSLPLERAINGVPGMTYMTSVSSNNGITIIQVFFNVSTDPDFAAVSVQNRVSTILDELPQEVIKAGVTTEKEVNSMLLYLNIMSDNADMNEKFIYNFADINILQELKRIDGVGFAEIMGQREYSMRVWLKPDKLVAYNIGANEITAAIQKSNLEAAPGKSGESSGDAQVTNMLQYVLRYTGKLNKPKEYENIVIRANEDGSILKLKDVARIEFGALSYGMVSKTDGKPSASIMIKQRPGSNARLVIENIKKRVAELKVSSFPPGMTYNFNYDVSKFLDASINEVIKTLFEAFLLVSLVVFIFLQDWRSTIIPALAVPVSIVGTFAFMLMFGFSINLLTLFALVLAIGIVVDDAIVVVEAVHGRMAEKHIGAMQATVESLNEISGAIIAITLVMSTVFIPVAFMSGPVGVFYQQFGITLAIAIIISGINALTLTPALCALLLRPHNETEKQNFLDKFFIRFNKQYDRLSAAYAKLLKYIIDKWVFTAGILVSFFVLAYVLVVSLPAGFIPTEDQSMIYINITTPAGATVERTEKVLKEIEVEVKKLSAVHSISTLSGYSLINDIAGSSYGMAMVNLKTWKERKESVAELMTIMAEKTSFIKDAEIQFFPPPPVPGFGNASGFELRLLDKTRGDDLQRTANVANKFIESLAKRKELGPAFTSFNASFPQYLIKIDQDAAAKLGVNVETAMSTLQTLVGGFYATNFIRFGQLYKVMLQADATYRKNPEDVLHLYVMNSKQEMISFSAFASMEKVYGPDQLTRYNMYTSALINGDAAPGYSSAQAIKAVQEVAQKELPKGYSFDWSGITREQVISGNQALIIFALCLLFVYLILSAQYESFLYPLAVLLPLPAGVIGAFSLLMLTGLENNIYVQVSLVMLIGLLGKNAILIVEVSLLKMSEGSAAIDAALTGAITRLRPILMTSFAFIAGLIPLSIATGAGAIGNRSIGTAAIGGMLIGTLGGLILVPSLFVIIAKLSNRLANKGKVIHASTKAE